jgi:hypothetical protein
MSNNSIDNIVSSYEFEHKKLAYYRLVRDAAKKEIDDNESDNPTANWKAKEAYVKALGSIAHFENSIDELDKDNGINNEYIQSLCSLTPDDNKHSEERIKEVVEKFISIIDSTRKAPIWLTLTADGIQQGEGDEEWYELLFKQEISPQYTLNYKVNKLDKPHSDLKRIASSCKIVVDDLSTRVRLTYKDSPAEPMANTYVFYWMYGDESDDELKNKLATSRRDLHLFEKTNCMLPLGVGLTDENGYLVKTRQMGIHTNKFQEINLDEGTFEIYPGTIYGGWDKRIIQEQYDFLNQDGSKKNYGRSIDFINELEAFRADAGNQWLNTSGYERVLRDFNSIEAEGSETYSSKALSAQTRILHSYIGNGYFIDEQDKTLENLSSAELSELKKASAQFFYPDRRYGFFAYPVNRGNFKTKSLLKLAEGENPVAWSGKVDEDNSAIALHCTLPEWDRRITVKLDALNLALYKTVEKVKPHTENIERLGGMSRLVELQQKYPYGLRNEEKIDIGEKFIGKINTLSDAIKERIEEPNNEYEFLNQQDIDEINGAAEALKDLIFKKEFLAEFNSYLKSAMNPEKESENGLANAEGKLNAGPYMEKEPYWGHIVETLMQCVDSLSKTHLSDHIWTKWVEPMLVDFSNQPEILESIKNLQGQEIFSEFIGVGKILEGVSDDKEEPIPVQDFRREQSTSFRDIQYSIEADEQARLDKEALSLEHNNPLLWVMNCYKSVAAPLVHNVPGAPSILQQAIDLYSDNISKKMMTSTSSFNIKINVALFRFCGVDMEGDKSLFKSFFNKMAITGYIAKSKTADAELYIKRLRKVSGVRNQKLDEQVRGVINQLGRVTEGDPLSETVYDKSFNFRWYKTLMFLTTLGMNGNTFRVLSENLKNEDAYGKSLYVMQASAETLYTVTLARNGFCNMFGKGFTNYVDGVNPGGKAFTELLGEGAARYVAAVAMLFSMRSAMQQYQLGNTSSAAFDLAMGLNILHTQLAYAAKTGVGRGVLTSVMGNISSRSVGSRIALYAIGATLGSVALGVASVIGACLVVYDTVDGIQDSNRTGLYRFFHHYLAAINKSQIPTLNDKHCHELYTGDQLPTGSNGLFKEIKNISDNNLLDFDNDIADWDNIDDYKFGDLSWRAVVPLYLQGGYSMQSINSMVKLESATTEQSRLNDRDEAHKVRFTVENPEDIIKYYEFMADPDVKGKKMLSGRSMGDIAAELAKGEFMPAQGTTEELTIMIDGKEKIISFDHLYFRQKQTKNGLDWEDINKQSHELYKPNYYV